MKIIRNFLIWICILLVSPVFADINELTKKLEADSNAAKIGIVAILAIVAVAGIFVFRKKK